MHCPKQIDHCSDLVLSLHAMTLCSRRYLGNAGVSLAGILSPWKITLSVMHLVRCNICILEVNNWTCCKVIRRNISSTVYHRCTSAPRIQQCTVTCAVQVVWECSYISERHTGQLFCAGRCQSDDQCLRSWNIHNLREYTQLMIKY